MRVCDSHGTTRNIRRLIAEKKVKISAIAIEMRVAKPTVYRWLDGIVPTIDHCVALAHLLDVSLDDLIATKDEEDEYDC